MIERIGSTTPEPQTWQELEERQLQTAQILANHILRRVRAQGVTDETSSDLYRQSGGSEDINERLARAALTISNQAQEISTLRGCLELSEARNKILAADASRDPLTGLLNRAGFDATFYSAAARAERLGVPFSMIFLDLNNFKAVNDELGHDIGDEVLKHTSNVLQSNTRDDDVIGIGRWGGDEITILINHAARNGRSTPEVAQEQFIQRVREIFSEQVIGSYPDENLRTVLKQLEFGISIGTAMWKPGQKPEELFKQADAAMYRDKKRQKS